MLLIQIIVLAAIISISCISIKIFILDPLKDKKKYEIYALRDELCMLAMSGVIDENGDNYKELLGFMNSDLCLYEEDFSVTTYIKVLSLKLKNESELLSVVEKIQSDEHISHIYKRYAHSVVKRFNRKLTVFKFVVYFSLILLYPINGIFKILQLIFELPSEKILYNSLKNNYKEMVRVENVYKGFLSTLCL